MAERSLPLLLCFAAILLHPGSGQVAWRATSDIRVDAAKSAERDPVAEPKARAPRLPRIERNDRRAQSGTVGSDPFDGRSLAVPVAGIRRNQIRDTFEDGRSRGRQHKALDIMAPRGTPVLAADDGHVAKIWRNIGGGLAVYHVDPEGKLVYYYAHLDAYADGLKEGQQVRRGDVIGYVGSTGNAPESAPHLHFGVSLLASPHALWGGEAVNPYPAMMREDAALAQR
ncbi:M23 family metallopeptidase [Ramlibacter sp.]|uniref:M23 family metallopeptidase n=1 Tax=Ramlibacter sp. TaxID=1917967 RepID=UPI003D1265CB